MPLCCAANRATEKGATDNKCSGNTVLIFIFYGLAQFLNMVYYDITETYIVTINHTRRVSSVTLCSDLSLFSTHNRAYFKLIRLTHSSFDTEGTNWVRLTQYVSH